MKYAFVFWWISLAAQPNAAVSVGKDFVDTTGVHRDKVRFFTTWDQCGAVQKRTQEDHKEDFILVSICGQAGQIGVYGGPEHSGQ